MITKLCYINKIDSNVSDDLSMMTVQIFPPFKISTFRKYKVSTSILEGIKEGDGVRITTKVRRGWEKVIRIEKHDLSSCVQCHQLHDVLTSQLCSDCASSTAEDVEWLQENDSKVLALSTKKYMYNRGATLTMQTKSGRVLCSTIYENRSEQYSTALSLNKGDKVTFSGWFSEAFPADEGDDSTEEKPDGFFNLETLVIEYN